MKKKLLTAKNILSYLPSSVYDLPPRLKFKDDPNRKDEWLIEAIPKNRRKVYNFRKIMKQYFDKDIFLEFGKNSVTICCSWSC